MTRATRFLVVFMCALLIAVALGVANAQTLERSDVHLPSFPMRGGTYAAGAATLERSPDGLAVSVRMPTPVSGTYTYPDGADPGVAEVFTLWVIIFNYPDLCTGLCDGDDLGAEAAARGGVYGADGVVAQGPVLSMSGYVALGQTPKMHAPLEAPLTAHVHYAIAPHGRYDPSDPTQLTEPIGAPSCACWWVAFFEDPPAARSAVTASGDPAVLPTAGSGGLAVGQGASPIAWASLAAGVTLAAGVGVRVARRRRHS